MLKILCILVIILTIISNVYSIVTWRSQLRLSYHRPYWVIEKKFLKWWVTGTINGDPIAYESERHASLFMRNHWKNKQRRLGKIQKISIKNLDKYLDN